MICKKCESQILDNSTYCNMCGERVDGKKVCPNCNNEIPNNSVFCSYCGTRLDNKNFCPECKKFFDGTYCPDCGQNCEPKKIKTSNTKNTQAQKSTLTLIKQCLLYGALCLLFIFCFFLSFDAIIQTKSAQTGRVGIRENLGATSFSYLIDIFKDANQLFNELGVYGKDYFAEVRIAYYIFGGLLAFSVGTCMIVNIVYFTIGTVKFVKSIQSKTPISMSKYVITPATVTLIAMIFICSTLSASAYGNGYNESLSVKVVFGAAPIVCIILVSTLLLASIVLHFISGNKVNMRQIINYVYTSCMLALILTFLLTLTTSVVSSNDKTMSVSINAFSIFFGMLMLRGMTPTDQLAELGTLPQKSAAIYVFFFILFVLGTILFIRLSNSILKEKKGLFETILSATSVILSIGYLIAICIFNGEATETKIASSSICAIIFSIALTTVSIISFIHRKNLKNS